ncbi:MAG: efflux RND transporter permease subunit, partial [Methylovirgula sp.]
TNAVLRCAWVMVVAMIPLIIAEGAGARSRFAIGVVIASGMSIGTLFTLFVTPAIYTFIARDHGKDRQEGVEQLPHTPAADRAAAE